MTIVKRVEKAIVLDRGRIVEEGSTADLLARNRFYIKFANWYKG